MAANGIDLSVGSAAETTATTDLIKESDALTINANATRAAWAARSQSVNLANQSLLQGTAANSISPFSAGFSSLLSGATTVAQGWYRDNELKRLLAARSE